jgi:hypothetical protein
MRGTDVIVRDWLRRKEIEGFAMALAQDLKRRFPPDSEKRTDKGVRRQIESIASSLLGKGAQFSRQRSLGVYGKAKLGNTLRWQLRALGYSEGFIESLVHELVLHLSRAR